MEVVQKLPWKGKAKVEVVKFKIKRIEGGVRMEMND